MDVIKKSDKKELNYKYCPKCGSPPSDHEIRNYSMMWHDGDIHCIKCDTFVRSFDAG